MFFSKVSSTVLLLMRHLFHPYIYYSICNVFFFWLKILSSFLILNNLIIMCFDVIFFMLLLLGSFWICGLILFISSGNFLLLFSQKLFFCSLYFSSSLRTSIRHDKLSSFLKLFFMIHFGYFPQLFTMLFLYNSP